MLSSASKKRENEVKAIDTSYRNTRKLVDEAADKDIFSSVKETHTALVYEHRVDLDYSTTAASLDIGN